MEKVLPVDTQWFALAKKAMDNKTKPLGSLGKLEEVACRLAAIQRSLKPSGEKVCVVVFAGDHGIAEEGVSLYPQEVTAQMVYNFLAGGAAINVMARHLKAELLVADMGVKGSFSPHPNLLSLKVREGTRNCLLENALTRSEVEEAIEKGKRVAFEYGKEMDLCIAGEMGIGNTSAASLVGAALLEIPLEDMVGRGTGVEGERFSHKKKILAKAFQSRTWERNDPLSILEAFGGLEIAGMAGFYLGVALLGKAFVVDGFIATTAFAVARALDPGVEEYAFLGHLSEEQGHRLMVEKLRMDPLLRLGMRLGEGTGALLAVPLLRVATQLLAEMASFEEAGVSREG
ncbi:MAG: nicotinate-nucleotide--dimethylbenzimidazole phosphoribosyltransferase [Brevinematales bacterium]|nr:nicotinate-nucleotide--dimethylbenzimidazole phosphoribosyltransferase [Brevinematales bacterium]